MAQIPDPEFWLNLSKERLQQPDIVGQILAAYQQPGNPAAQGYDPNLIQALNSGAPQTEPYQPTLSVPPIQFPAGQTMDQYAQSSTAPQGTVLAGARVAPTPAASAPTTEPSGYEDYLKLFEKTLGDKPELDTKKRNQLATVALINSLGQALRQVVDFTGKSKYGSPINPQQDNLTPGLLAQYEKESQDYEQRKDRYDLQKTNTMQQALQYAYGDEKARDQYEKQLDLLGRQQDFSREQTGVQLNENEKERAARAALADKQADLQGKRDETQYAQDLEKLKKNYEYESKLIGQRANDAFNLVKEKYGAQTAAKSAMELAKKSIQVTDEDPNNPVTIPPQIYLDILQKQIALQNQDFTEFLTSTDFNATNNAGDIMVARYWKDFYKPVYDEQGNVASWESRGAQYPSSTPGGDNTPSIFIPKTK